jgi:hypothetical protein
MSNINKVEEVIINVRKAIGRTSAFPYVFGYAWAMLTEEQRQQIINMSEKLVEENK